MPVTLYAAREATRALGMRRDPLGSRNVDMRAVPLAAQHAVLVLLYLRHGVDDPDTGPDQDGQHDQREDVHPHAVVIVVRLFVAFVSLQAAGRGSLLRIGGYNRWGPAARPECQIWPFCSSWLDRLDVIATCRANECFDLRSRENSTPSGAMRQQRFIAAIMAGIRCSETSAMIAACWQTLFAAGWRDRSGLCGPRSRSWLHSLWRASPGRRLVCRSILLRTSAQEPGRSRSRLRDVLPRRRLWRADAGACARQFRYSFSATVSRGCRCRALFRRIADLAERAPARIARTARVNFPTDLSFFPAGRACAACANYLKEQFT